MGKFSTAAAMAVVAVMGSGRVAAFVPSASLTAGARCAGHSCRTALRQAATSRLSMSSPAAVETDTAVATDEPLEREDLRNLAIIAHVDHGKTTLVDCMLQQSSVFREGAKVEERVMDSNDQEKERGITILAKNCAINYEGIKFNLVDTPGHSDFGGEVERILNMVDGVLLVVDSVEGPKPQTRFVLKKALAMGLQAVVVVNKVDRPSARCEYVVDSTFDLFCELNANDEQSDFQVVYTSAIQGIAGDDYEDMADDMEPLFKAILKMPKPKVRPDASLQMLTANIDYDDFKGKLGIGRVHSGTIKKGQNIGMTRPGEEVRSGKISEMFIFDNLGRKSVDQAEAGEIVMIAGLPGVGIGDTIVDPEDPQPMVPIAVEEPTVRMTFGVNKSPLAGREGKLLTSRMIRDRLYKELDRNVALRVTPTDSADVFEVSGRGQLHLTVLIETMRREGFELLIGPPTVITKKVDGVLMEPFEKVEVQVPDEYVGSVVDILSKRKGEMINMLPSSEGQGMTTIEYLVPTRGMIGIRTTMLTATRGQAVLDTLFEGYKKYAGEIESRDKGSLLAYETGSVTTNGIIGAQVRGSLFCSVKDDVFADMIIGIHQRPGDLKVNVCKTKALNNIRSANKSISEGVVPPLEMNLDMAVEYIGADEQVEVTPTLVRMCKNADMNKKAPQRGK